MIQEQRVMFHGKDYIRYVGEHAELRDILKKFDLVLLQAGDSEDNEFLKIQGTMLFRNGDSSYRIRCNGIYVTSDFSSIATYRIKQILRPIIAMPDSQGLWRDNEGDLWVVDDCLNMLRITRFNGTEMKTDGLQEDNEDNTDYEPFTKLNLYDEDGNGVL